MTSKFSPKWNPQYVEKLREHLLSGERFTKFASVIGVDETTIYDWCKDHPAFRKIKMEYEKPIRKKIYA